MDDPWGSPWADEAARPLPTIKAGTRQGPVTTAKPFPLNETSRSPWDDDDEFGEWAALPISDDFRISLSNSGPDSELIQDEGHDVHLESLTRVAQPSSQTNIGPTTLISSGSQISPQPWGKGNLRAIQNEELQASDMTTAHVHRDLSFVGNMQEANAPENTSKSPIDQIRQVEKPLRPAGVLEPSIEASIPHQAQDDPQAKSECNAASIINNMMPEQGGPQPSRPSSSPSDRSPHEEEFVESPGTSFDEDTETRPTLERKWPKQAEGNTGLHDALATSMVNNDFKEPYGEADGEEDHARTPVTTDSKIETDALGDREEECSGDSLIDDVKPTNCREYSKASVPKDDSNIVEDGQFNEGLTPVTFDVDASLVTKLFVQSPTLPAPKNNTIHDLNDVENVIHNSFYSTEQRKVWYRISRYGTMRKHNTGDEDTYIRMNWKNSRVRAESIKIVARWIEEDRAGAGLGVGSSGSSGSLFGWGQRFAAPISISEVLASKSGKTYSYLKPSIHQAELAIPGTGSLPGPASKPEAIEHGFSSNGASEPTSSLIAPQFSWSTGTTSVPAASMEQTCLTPPSLASSPQHPDNFAPVLETPRQSPLGGRVGQGYPLLSPPALLKQPKLVENKAAVAQKDSLVLQAPVAPASVDSDLDDDWGEMAMAPSIATVTQTSRSEQGSTEFSLEQPLTLASAFNNPAVGESRYGIRQELNSNAQVNGAGSSPLPQGSGITSSIDFSQVVVPSQPVVNSTLPSQPILSAATSQHNTLTNNDKMSKEELEHAKIVKNIVQNLPDLSYMLRR